MSIIEHAFDKDRKNEDKIVSKDAGRDGDICTISRLIEKSKREVKVHSSSQDLSPEPHSSYEVDVSHSEPIEEQTSTHGLRDKARTLMDHIFDRKNNKTSNELCNIKSESGIAPVDSEQEGNRKLLLDNAENQHCPSAKSGNYDYSSGLLKVINIDPELIISNGFVCNEEGSNKVITNEYRHIKHNVLSNVSSKKSSNMIMVTSANPGDGKTFTAVNLALSIAAEKDKTVLLVDLNVYNPSICSMFGSAERTGLIDYLSGEEDEIQNVIYRTSIENLKILPSGKYNQLSNEFLSSEKMKKLADELSTRYQDRVIIFDCPALLGLVETETISQFVGQAIVVVTHSHTKVCDIENAITSLNNDLMIGFIVNKTTDSGYSRYGYDYENTSKGR